MSEFECAVPGNEPAEDIAVAVTKIGLSAVPLVGQAFAETLALAAQRRQLERQHEFNQLIARAIDSVMLRLEAPVDPGILVDSDEFLSAVSFAQRVAAESSSSAKRDRLAAVVANSGECSGIDVAEREEFRRLAAQHDDLHAWLLNYLSDPAEWLRLHGYARRDERDESQPFQMIFSGYNWTPPVMQALQDLGTSDLVVTRLHQLPTWTDAFAVITDKGNRLLEFMNATEQVRSTPPGAMRR